eukprot:2392-Heterococcus_DN1.PRE.2
MRRHAVAAVLRLTVSLPALHHCCALQILNLDARSQHALLHFVSAYTSDAICGHAWLDSRNVVLLHESGLQEMLSVASAPIGTFVFYSLHC